MSIVKKVAYNTSVQLLGKLVTTAISLTLVIYLSRYLGVFGYGEYTTIFAYLGFFSVFVDFGLYLIAVREISKPDVNIEKIVGNLFSLRLILAFLVFSLASGIGFLLPYSSTVKAGIVIGGVALALVTITQATFSVFQAKLRMDFAVWADVFGRIVVLGLTLFFMSQGYEFLFIIFAYVVGNLLTFLIGLFFTRKFIKLRPRLDIDVWRGLLIEAIPLGIVVILSMVHFKIDIVLLSVLPLGEKLVNMREVGVYGVSYRIIEVLIVFPAIFVGSVFPILSKQFFEKSDNFKKTFQKSFDFLIIVSVPLVVGVYTLAPYIVNIIGGREFSNAVLPLQILIFAVAFYFLSYLLSHLLIAANLQKKLIFISILSVAINVLLNLVFIPLYSYLGAAVVTVISWFLALVVHFYLVIRHLRITPSFRAMGKSIIASFLMGVSIVSLLRINFFVNWGNFSSLTIFMRFLSLFSIIVMGTLIYFLVLYMLKGFSKKDFLKIIGKEH